MATAHRETFRRARPQHRNGGWQGEQHFEDMVQNAGHEAREYVNNVADRTREYMDDGKEYVAGNPVKSISIAAGIGILVGMLLLALRPSRH